MAPVPVKSSPAVSTSKRSHQPDLPVDYQVLLLALADEYITKAHGMTAVLVRSMAEADVEQYHKLIASGLGCMESVLKNFKFPDPRIEARLVHRYCSLLFEETENDDVAHEVLSRAIKMCERNKLTDLRYSLEHLQLRFNFRSRPVAALKMVDQLLSVIEAYKHTSWVYATRFLRASLSLQMSPPDTNDAVHQMRVVAHKAEENQHVPILTCAAAFEALIHLRSDNLEAVQLAQRALAAARKHQLDPSLHKIPQLAALLDCLDLCCDLVRLTPTQAVPKMRQMQELMDDAHADKSWRPDGSFCVPINQRADPEMDIAANTGGVFERNSDGQRALVFRWIRRSELFHLGYLFSGIATAHKNGVDRKAEKYLSEGAKISAGRNNVPYTCVWPSLLIWDLTDNFVSTDRSELQSLKAAYAQEERRAYFHKSMQLHLVLVRCNRSDWVTARETLKPFARSLSRGARQEASDSLDVLTIYLAGVIKQGTGDLSGALVDFTCPALTLDPRKRAAGIVHELHLLAAMNTILILRSDPAKASQIQSLLSVLEQACHSHPDKSFAAAIDLVHVSCTPNLPIIKTKMLLSTAMATAKRVSNTHLSCVTMNLMNATFFTNIVGEQAEKSARLGQNLSRRSANPLWVAVASGLLAGTCDICGLKDAVVAAREDGQAAMAALPDVVKEAFQRPR